MSAWTITPIANALGAYVDGIDLAEPVSSDAASELRSLLYEHHVLVFRDHDLSPAQHVGIGEVFGDPYVHPFLESIDAHDAVLRVAKEPEDDGVFGGEFWHADITFQNPPSSVSLLYSIDVPDDPCGDTIFANQFMAYEQLSPGMQSTLSGLNAVHAYPDMVESDETAAVHPVVRTHPGSGRKALFVNAAFVSRFVGWTEAESAPLLAQLAAHQTRPEFQGRVQWSNDQLTVWDNRAVLHYAMNDYPGKRRVLQRVTVMEREGI